MKKKLTLSTLGKTWILDFDGTLVEHNGYKSGGDQWLPGAREFLLSIPEDDYVMILTAREQAARDMTVDFLDRNGIRYNEIRFEMPMGERILFNDNKPSGLVMGHVVECTRNEGLEGLEVIIDETL